MSQDWSANKVYGEDGKRICAFPGCGRRHNARGLCCTHQGQFERGAELKLIPARDPDRGCAVDGCDARRHAGAYCAVHYARLKRTGDPLKITRPTPVESFYARVPKTPDENGCLTWQGFTYESGYGMVSSRKSPVASGTRLAHRAAYELVHGPIADGMHVDHLCRNRACVNPDHLEVVTPQENTRRGLLGVLRTHCFRGHELTDDNSYKRPGAKNGRSCRTCAADARKNSARERERAARRAARVAAGWVQTPSRWPEGGRDYVRSTGMNENTVNSRLARGMKWEDAISKPVRASYQVAGVGER